MTAEEKVKKLFPQAYSTYSLSTGYYTVSLCPTCNAFAWQKRKSWAWAHALRKIEAGAAAPQDGAGGVG